MTTATEAPVTTEDLIEEAVDAAYAADGYVNDDGDRDNNALIDAVHRKVIDARVGDLKDRETKAISRSDLVVAVFPSLPGPDAWHEQDDPEVAKEAHGRVKSNVWDLVKNDHRGKVQVRLEGLVLCRTTIGDDTKAVYVTDDLACIREDFGTPLTEAQRRAYRRAAANLAMVADRLPQHAAAMDRIFERGAKRALEEGRGALAPAIEAAEDK